MAKPASPIKPRSAGWYIKYPGLNQTVPAGAITVQVDDAGDNNQYLAAIYNDGGPMPPYGGTPMHYNSISGYYEAACTVGAPPNKKVIVYVQGDSKDYKITPFNVNVSASGSGSGSGSGCGVVVACSSISVPTTIYGTVSSPCGQISGVSFALTHMGLNGSGNHYWQSGSVMVAPGRQNTFTLTCVGTTWHLTQAALNCYEFSGPPTGTSEPFTLTFATTVQDTTDCPDCTNGQTVTCTITY